MTKALVALALLFALCGAVASSARDDVISVIREQLEAGKDIDDLDDNDNETDDYDVKPKRKAGPSTGSCREARLCCEGRDPSCSVTGSANANSIFDEPGAACYCDHACMAVGDCCRDYKQTCGAQDCIVSEWGSWSECDVQCGLGTSSRTRDIYRQPRNGGKECPELTQKRGCHAFNCEVSRAALKASRETALILKSSYSSLRAVNESRDIRWNLRLAYPKDPAKENGREYCVVFEVTKSRKGCENSLDEATARLLLPDSKVCVACQATAWRKHLGYRCHGHGVDDKATRWSAVSGNNCHGRWIRRGAFKECPCHTDGRPDFIFV